MSFSPSRAWPSILLLWAVVLASPRLVSAGQTSDPPPQDPAPPASQLKKLSIEELTRISIISASRHTEPVTQAAASISVVTGEAIRRAGVSTLPEALRLVVGIAMGREGQSWALSARGFSAATANKMVVQIDGRSVYTPLFSGVFWDAQDVVLADVDRIEVIRGVGGTLWGANAMNGVINIITKLAGDTQGALVEAGLGSATNTIVGRYGGVIGGDGRYRVYTKFRNYRAQPLAFTGEPGDDALGAIQAGFRMDFGPTSPTSMTLQGDLYHGKVGLLDSTEDIGLDGANVLARMRRTFQSGSQLQVQAYYDTTRRAIPTQYTERRHTVDTEMQYRFSAGPRQEIVSGVGYMASHDRVIPTAVLTFDPPSRTLSLVNLFAQDQISILPGRLDAIVGAKLEHNSYTGVEIQPTGRLRWIPAPNHVVWGGVSRGVRMPSRFDRDLRFMAGTPVVVLTGSEDFVSETVVSTEVGYRLLAVPGAVASVTAFFNDYDRLRTQEPTLPAGIPITIANGQNARVNGIELATHFEPFGAWQLWAGYAWLRERFSFDPSSHDTTGGSLEHNDPAHQITLRSWSDLPGQFAADATFRWISALPRPAVRSYAELTLRVARPITSTFEVELVGDNLLHSRHIEFVNIGPSHAVARSIFLRLSWRPR